MVKLRWFPFDAVDWRNSHFIRSLSRAQTGAFVSLLVEAWLEKHCSLPTDKMALKKLAQWDQKISLLEPVIAHLIPHPDYPDRLTDERLYQEWVKAEKVSVSHQQAAKIRWQKPSVPTNNKPLIVSKDRSSKGLSPIVDEVQRVTDKIFPPV